MNATATEVESLSKTKPQEKSSYPPKTRFWRRWGSRVATVEALGFTLFVFAISFPPFEVWTEVDLSVHMLQHVLIAAGGVMISYPLYRRGFFDRLKSRRNALLGFALIAAILIFWHLPVNWDGAVLSFWTHVTEHVCFLVVGLCIGIFIPMMADNLKVMVAVLAVSAHMFYGFALYIITEPVYPLYPVEQQSLLGLLLFAPSPVYLGSLLYFNLHRESRKLEREAAIKAGTLRDPHRKGAPKLRIFLGALVLLMLLALGVYYAGTYAEINAASYANSPQVALIYIEEGPVAWQYSPQHITVVLGVNSTVTWISHSFTEDTVTSANGTYFSSGAISPGQTFIHSFKEVGTFAYYCQYHLWMQGTVTVLAHSG